MPARERFVGTALALVLGFVMLTGALVVTPGEAAALPADAWIAGVVDDGSDPVEDVYIKVMMFSSGSIDVGYDFTDSDGMYAIGVPGGFDYMIVAANGSYYMEMASVTVDAGETAYANLTLTSISPEVADVTVKGFVLDEWGAPAVGGHVLGISNDEMGGDMPAYANVTIPNGTGYFEVNVIPSSVGGGVVAFDNEGYSMTENGTDSPLVSLETYWFNITLMSLHQFDDAAIHGQVTEAGTGLPLEGVLVSVEVRNEFMEGYSNYTFTDSSGDFAMDLMNGSARIWFVKGGYSMAMYEDEVIPEGSDLQYNASLTALDCVVRGNVTDLKSSDPVTSGQVVMMDSLGNLAVTMIDGSGHYELGAFSGVDMVLMAQADGYAQNFTFITLETGDEVWHDFGLHPMSAWINGTVTSMITGLPVEGAWVWANSPSASNGDDTDEHGNYSIPVAPGEYSVGVSAMDYRYASAEVTVMDESTTIQDFELIPNYIEETVLVSGNVTDADSADPIDNANVRIAFPDMSFWNQTNSKPDGYYEMYVAPLDGLQVSVTASGYAPFFTTIDCAGVPSLPLEVQLVQDTYTPNLTLSLSPADNVTWINPMTIEAEAEDAYMRELALYNVIQWYSEVGYDHKYIFAGDSASFDPFNGYSTMDYSRVGDVYTVHETFDGTVDTDHAVGGWLVSDNCSAYLSANKHWWYSDVVLGVRASFTNATLSAVPGAAFFDPDTGEYLFFHFDWGFPEAQPDDVAAYLEFKVSHIVIEEGNPWNWSWYGEETLCEGYAVDFVFSTDPVVPSGDYVMMFVAVDFADHWNLTLREYTVDNDPPVAYAGEDDASVVDVEYTLDGSGSSDNFGIVSYTWEFDDGGLVTLNGEMANYTFTSLGSYVVELTVVDGAGHTSVDTVSIEVVEDLPPEANAGDDQTVDEGETVFFDGTGSWDDVDITNYTWTIVDLSEDMYGPYPSYTFDEPGLYDVELVVTDTIGQQSGADTMTVTVLDITPPVADAGDDQPDVTLGQEVTFNGSLSSDNVGVVSWTWTFYDGANVTLYGETASYIFSAVGVYNVTLTVADAAGNEDTDVMQVSVHADTTPPVADAGEDQEDVAYGDEVQFDGSGSYDDVAVVSWTWTFDDDGAVTREGETAVYTFSAPGVYNVTLTVEDSAGNEGVDWVIITVLDNEPPVADAGPDPEGIVVGQSVTLDGTDSTDNHLIAQYVWTFDDDGTDMILDGDVVEYAFMAEGEYTITLTVTDVSGNSDSDEVVVRVGPLNAGPVADAGLDQMVSEGDTVTFDGSGSTDDVGVVSYTWTFDYDGGVETLTGVSPEFVFEIPGSYIVTLNVTDAEGEWDTDTVVIVVEDKPSTMLTEYWWVFAAAAAVAVIVALLVLMRHDKGGPSSRKGADEGEELEDEEDLPPPDDEDL